MHMVATDNAVGANAISDAYLGTEFGSQPENIRSWEAYVEYIRLVFGKGGQLANLKRLSDENPKNSEILSYLGRAYGHYQHFRESAAAFENAAGVAGEVRAKSKLLREAASAYQQAQNVEAALMVISRMKSMAVNTRAVEVEVLSAQRRFAENAQDDEVLIGAMERLLDIDPADNDTRFALAYKYSELGGEDLALFHYSKILDVERSAVAWNNLGVALAQLGLPVKSVSAYRKAEEMGETLAMSNLANKFLGAGFVAEAQKVCDVALTHNDFHKNIGTTVARLKEAPEEEDGREKDFLEKVRPISDFYKELGRAAAKVEPATLAGPWQGPDCMLEVTYGGAVFAAAGSYEQASLGLLALYLGRKGGSSSKADSAPVRYRIEYSGKSTGCAIVGRVVRKREDETAKASSLLAIGEDEPKVLMVLSDHGSVLRVLEVSKKSTPRFYDLKRHLAAG